MIEGGVAGGSALQQASQRRAAADRLLAEAEWLEALAADERAIATQLAALPPAYALLHDLRLPGSKGNIDHLVVGPSGAFVVVTRRCPHTVEFREGQLWAGSQSLSDVLTAAHVESQLLTQLLRTQVVAVLALLEATLPAEFPSKVAGVFVCTGELVCGVVTGGSHTLLPTHLVAEITERGLPLLHNGGSTLRTESALGVPAELAPDTSFFPVVPPHPPVQRIGRSPDATHPPKEKSGRSRSIRFVAVALVAMCVLAIGLGSLVSAIWGDSASDEGTPRTVDAVDVAGTTTAIVPVADPVAPAVAFAASCPAPGGGWQLSPVWPGDVAGLVRYEIELQNLDATWSPLPSMETADAPWTSLLGQPANAAYTMRMTAVLGDDARVVSAPTIITAPATDC